LESGHTLHALDKVINSLKKQNTMTPGSRAPAGRWAAGLDVKDCGKEKAEVIYHVGCRTSFDESLWKVARATVTLLQKAGVDVGVSLQEEACCGGRAYQMGYKDDYLRQASLMPKCSRDPGRRQW